jgi:hypothetical protein
MMEVQNPPTLEEKEAVVENSALNVESDDDEPITGEEYDPNLTYNNIKLKRALNGELEPEPFRFYEHEETPVVGFHDLLRSIKTMKQMIASGTISPPKQRKKKIRTFDIKSYQKTIDLQRSLPSSYKQFRISAFHQKTNKWDGSRNPGDEVLKELYRTPCRDPTGKVIFSLARDLTIPEGKKAWYPAESGRDFPNPQCSLAFQIPALAHLMTAIERIEEEYKKMPEHTQAESALKATVSADLNNLKMEKDRLLLQVEQNPEFQDKNYLNETLRKRSKSPTKGKK